MPLDIHLQSEALPVDELFAGHGSRHVETRGFVFEAGDGAAGGEDYDLAH